MLLRSELSENASQKPLNNLLKRVVKFIKERESLFGTQFSQSSTLSCGDLTARRTITMMARQRRSYLKFRDRTFSRWFHFTWEGIFAWSNKRTNQRESSKEL